MDMQSKVDYKKLMAIELQVNLNELEEDSRFVFVTDGAFIEGTMNMKESDFEANSNPLGQALHITEHEPNISTKDMDVINIKACFYLKDVKMTPFANQSEPIHLDEFILFSDHISGVTLVK